MFVILTYNIKEPNDKQTVNWILKILKSCSQCVIAKNLSINHFANISHFCSLVFIWSRKFIWLTHPSSNWLSTMTLSIRIYEEWFQLKLDMYGHKKKTQSLA